MKKQENNNQSKSKKVFILFYTECCELFGRFGITALLVLYLTKSCQFSDSKAFSMFAAFTAMIFITPVIGGFLSDRYLGKIHAIVLGGSMMSLGNLILSFGHNQRVYLWLNDYCNR